MTVTSGSGTVYPVPEPASLARRWGWARWRPGASAATLNGNAAAMRPLRGHAGPAFCLFLLLIVGCAGSSGGGGGVVHVTAGGTGRTGGSSGTTGASAGTGATAGATGDGGTTASTGGDLGETTGATAGGGDYHPTFGDAALDVGFARTGAPPFFDRMAGTGDATGYATIDYSYDEDGGAGDLEADAYTEGSAGSQDLTLWFTHRTFVKVGTRLNLEYAYYEANKPDGLYENGDADGARRRWSRRGQG